MYYRGLTGYYRTVYRDRRADLVFLPVEARSIKVPFWLVKVRRALRRLSTSSMIVDLMYVHVCVCVRVCVCVSIYMRF